eukprot:357065-Pyramimonas_sp.AAC.1
MFQPCASTERDPAARGTGSSHAFFGARSLQPRTAWAAAMHVFPARTFPAAPATASHDGKWSSRIAR